MEQGGVGQTQRRREEAAVARCVAFADWMTLLSTPREGSRSTNFAGILKQGLRIAPPEAPVTGYMSGKGVYFADVRRFPRALRTAHAVLQMMSKVPTNHSNTSRSADLSCGRARITVTAT